MPPRRDTQPLGVPALPPPAPPGTGSRCYVCGEQPAPPGTACAACQQALGVGTGAPAPVVREDATVEIVAPTAEAVSITVNARLQQVPAGVLSYEDLVRLAWPTAPAGILFTVTYRRGPAERPHGSLVPGEAVRVQAGMICDVCNTGAA